VLISADTRTSLRSAVRRRFAARARAAVSAVLARGVVVRAMAGKAFEWPSRPTP